MHAEQMAGLAHFLRQIGGPLIVAGDFNTPPWAGSLKRLLMDTGLAPALGFMPTWPAWPLPVPQLALDHILVSSDLDVVRAGTGPLAGSDHLPVWAEIVPALGSTRAPNWPLLSRLAAALHLGGELAADLGGEQRAARDLSR
jgi:endonuclease/exonuclease/phosphatase (EEP) superfamily protein YafD